LLAVVQGKIVTADRLRSLYQPLSDPAENSRALMLTVNLCPLQIDFKQHRTWLDGFELQLTTSRMFLLEHLAQQPNRLIGVQ
jgi:DNA-binding response OmpR family regulator